MKADKLRCVIDTIDFGMSDLESAESELEEAAKDETSQEIDDALRDLKSGMRRISKAYWLLENQFNILRIKEYKDTP